MPKPQHRKVHAAKGYAPQPELVSEPGASLPLKLIGLLERPGQPPAVALTLPDADPCKAISVPLSLCVSSRHAALDEFFMRPGFMSARKGISAKTLAAELRSFAETTTIHALDTEGIQSFEHNGVTCKVWIKSGNVYWLTKKPDGAEVVLVGKIARSARKAVSAKKFRKAFGEVLQKCPRLLIVLLFALAAMLLGEFDIASVALALVGMSTSGKTLTQRATSMLVYGEDRVEHFDGTPQGIIDAIRAAGASALFFEDVHGANAGEALVAALMAVGNGANGRKRSGYSRPLTADTPIRGTLIMSAEAGLADTIRAAGQVMLTGQFARGIELHLGQYGMFDVLCGHDSSAELAEYVKDQSKEYAGFVGDAFVETVATNWESVNKMWLSRRDEVRDGILQAADIGKPTGVTNRQLETLTFIGFVGAIAARYDVLPVKRGHVYEALGLLLREQERRLQGSRTPAGQKVVEAVRHFILTYPARFLPIERAGDPTQVNGLAGYLKLINGRPTYLFFAEAFDAEFVSKFGREASTHLRDAGHLVCQGKRGNRYQAQVRLSGPEDRRTPMNFVAVSQSILAADA
ncbi:DUF927 domain-containing protein [Roseateles puraquae]|uniref:DUF927 domain-containing protein n=1 Tax=Roseateles puraquae TaxID=431059 RepID=A0A254N4C3_9BURK|nr:DUF927 domain-containing protein [Roseateles puraquae]MDG0853368.1 DUF927 domain-containing protein [Roseateles puraquae]OWR02946.1 hypothetical protein CDO81_15275 [Roseateles puraquae]